MQRFDLDQGGTVVLLAQVAVEQGRSHDPSATRTLRLTVQPAGSGTPDLVTAESAAVGQMADQVADLLRALRPAALAEPVSGRQRR